MRFHGETDVVDEGGVTRELFNLGACHAAVVFRSVGCLCLSAAALPTISSLSAQCIIRTAPWPTCADLSCSLFYLYVAIREFISKRNCLGVAGAVGERLFFTRSSPPAHAPSAAASVDHWSEEYMLGVIVGLAFYNGVLVKLPLVDVVYKLLFNGQVNTRRDCETHAWCCMMCFSCYLVSFPDTCGMHIINMD